MQCLNPTALPTLSARWIHLHLHMKRPDLTNTCQLWPMIEFVWWIRLKQCGLLAQEFLIILDCWDTDDIWQCMLKHARLWRCKSSHYLQLLLSHLIQCLIGPCEMKGQVSLEFSGEVVAQGASEVMRGFHQLDWHGIISAHGECGVVHATLTTQSLWPNDRWRVLYQISDENNGNNSDASVGIDVPFVIIVQ